MVILNVDSKMKIIECLSKKIPANWQGFLITG